MYKDLFLSSGLNDNEAIVYEYLLKHGKSTAGEIIKKTPLKRGVVYNTVSDLVLKNLVAENKISVKGAKGKNIISEFSPNHPESLRNYLESEKGKLEKAEKNLEANISTLISDFSLVSGKPGVRYFEGEEGVKKVLEDTLTSKTEILTIADAESVNKHVRKINEEYVKTRRRMGIKKRLMVLDTEYAREHFKEKDAFTQVKLLDINISPFDTSIQIYDNKIAYITFSEKFLISTIIDDSSVYSMQKALFEFMWERI